VSAPLPPDAGPGRAGNAADAPGESAEGVRARRPLTSPVYVVGAILALVVLTVLVTPNNAERTGDSRLTTHSTASQGARGLLEVARRLGWVVEQRVTPLADTLPADVVYATLAPPIAPTSREAHALLDAVRRGAGLLLVVNDGEPLADSLGLGVSPGGGVLTVRPRAAGDSAVCRGDEGGGTISWFDGRVHSYWLVPADSARPDGRARPGAVTFAVADSLRVRRRTRERPAGVDTVPLPAALGFPLGRGRVVAVADPDLLRNDVLRVCRWGMGVTAVRMLEWLSEGTRSVARIAGDSTQPAAAASAAGAARSPGGPARPNGRAGRRIVFDEYHHGFGTHASAWRTIRRALTETAPGRAVLQGAAAALVLLAAVGARALPPRRRGAVERRSPLEHVEALARAYGQVKATRLATRRLMRGLRRRHGHAGWRAASDDDFLRALAERTPAVAPAVARLLDAAQRPVSPAEFAAVGAAVDEIDRTLTR